MYKNVWKIYTKSFSIELFKMMPKYNLNIMFSTLVELDELYLLDNDHFEIYKVSLAIYYKYTIVL